MKRGVLLLLLTTNVFGSMVDSPSSTLVIPGSDKIYNIVALDEEEDAAAAEAEAAAAAEA